MKQTHRPTGQVDVQVKGSHLVVTQALHDVVVQKMTNLDRYFDRLQSIEVELCHEKTRDSSLQNRVEATTRIKGRTVRVTSSHEDMYAAIDDTVDKLHRSLSRLKERSKSHGSDKITSALSGEETALDLDERADREGLQDGSNAPTIVRERVELQPQFEEEAMADMIESGLTFHVFLNAHTENVNVLYRHGDGTYGLIEPQTG